jgi:hypothetical protein
MPLPPLPVLLMSGGAEQSPVTLSQQVLVMQASPLAHCMPSQTHPRVPTTQKL